MSPSLLNYTHNHARYSELAEGAHTDQATGLLCYADSAKVGIYSVINLLLKNTPFLFTWVYKLAIAALLLIVTHLLMPNYSYAANYQCSVIPQDSIDITAQQVEVSGASGNFVITPDGNVSRNGTLLTLSDNVKNQAKTYQSGLRQELPYIYNGASQQINDFHNALDALLIKKMGSSSKTRVNLQDLKQQLTAQLNQVLMPTKEGIRFDAQAAKVAEKTAQETIKQKLGAIVQNGINEMGSQGLQAVLGGLDDFQSSMQKTWQTQVKRSSGFAADACGRVRDLEDQKSALIRALS